MTAESIAISQLCRNCGASLQLEEMHYYDHGDGTATCEKCEIKWMEELDAWLGRKPILIHKGNTEDSQ